jgi:hypothetical protein
MRRRDKKEKEKEKKVPSFYRALHGLKRFVVVVAIQSSSPFYRDSSLY